MAAQKPECIKVSPELRELVAAHGGFSPAMKALALLGLASIGTDLAPLRMELEELAGSRLLSPELKRRLRELCAGSYTTDIPQYNQRPEAEAADIADNWAAIGIEV